MKIAIAVRILSTKEILLLLMKPVKFTKTMKTLAKHPSIISAIIAKVAMTTKKLIASELIVFKRGKTKFSSRVTGCEFM